MILLKKLIFAPLFLLSFILLISQLNPLLSSHNFIFALSLESLIQLVKIAALFISSALFFALFATIASDWKIILPVLGMAALMPLFFMPLNPAIIFSFLCAVSFLLAWLSLANTLKSYLTFNAPALIGPSVRTASALLIISFSIIYFLASSKTISQTAFEIPDSLIDAALKMTPPEQTAGEKNAGGLPDINITPEQIEMVRKNPQIIKQYGLDPKILDTLTPNKQSAVKDLGKNMIKQSVKDQIQKIIEPYQNLIPVVLTLLLFFTLQSLTGLINFSIYPLVWLMFLILEKIDYIKFEVEQRPVKKLIV